VTGAPHVASAFRVGSSLRETASGGYHWDAGSATGLLTRPNAKMTVTPNSHPSAGIAPAALQSSELTAEPTAPVTRGLTLDRLWLLVPPIGLFAWLQRDLIDPADFWWHLRTGQIIVQTGHIPTTDLFTFTRAGMPWTNQAWLMQVLLYLVYRLGDLRLIVFLHALSVALGYLLVELGCLHAPGTRSRDAALATLFAMGLGSLNWGVRPQSMSFLFFGLLVYLVERHRSGRLWTAWLWPPVMALWANLHGAFIFGLLFLLIYAGACTISDLRGSRRLRQPTVWLLAAVFLSVLALSLNPQGPVGIARYIVGFGQSKSTLALNQEFAALSIRERDGAVFFLVTLLFVLVVSWRKVRLPGYLIAAMLVFGVVSLYARRVLPWFGMAFAPAWAIVFSSFLAATRVPAKERRRRPLNYLLAGLLLAAAVGSVPWIRDVLPFFGGTHSYVNARRTPVAAVRTLCYDDERPRVFSGIAYGSYLTWACPAAPIFMDTRFELYPSELWADYLLVVRAQFGWEDVLDRHAVDALLLDKEQQAPLVAAARASPTWTPVYEDAVAIIFQRQGS